MDHPAPLDVLEMTVFATADKTDRRGLSALPVIALIFKPLRWFEILETHEPPAVWWIASNGIASEPSRKNCHLYRRGWTFRIASIDRWRSEFRWPVADNASIILQAQVKQSLEARLLNDLECPDSEHLPMIEAQDKYRSFWKIEHGAGPECSDDLAEPNLVVCHGALVSGQGLAVGIGDLQSRRMFDVAHRPARGEPPVPWIKGCQQRIKRIMQ